MHGNVLAIQEPFLTGDSQYIEVSFTFLDCIQKTGIDYNISMGS